MRKAEFTTTSRRRFLKIPAAQTNLTDNIAANLRTKNMGGVDFDFEYIPRAYAADYVNLVARTQARLSPQGYLTSVALALRCAPIRPGFCTRGTTTRAWGARQITAC